MISVRPLTVDDFAFGMELKTEAHWNQTEADWRRAWELEPVGCFVGLCDGTPAATLTTAVFGQVGWIAMVLTRAEFRGRGLATTLLKHSLQYLEGRGVVSVRLDATALGKPVYEKLGFTVDSEVTRFYGRPTPTPAVKSNSRIQLVPMEPQDLPEAAALDADATCNDRTRLLELVYRDRPEACFVAMRENHVAGFCQARSGSRATQLGPCIAADVATGAALLTNGLQQLGASGIYLDVPHQNKAARELAIAAGLNAERDFFRMTRGKQVSEKSERIWANYGPEKG